MAGFPPNAALDLCGLMHRRTAIVYDHGLCARWKPRCCARRASAGCDVIDGLDHADRPGAPLAFELFFGAPAPREHDAELRALLTS